MSIREPTTAEKDMTIVNSDGETAGFIPLAGQSGRRILSPHTQMKALIGKYQLEATKKGLPFAARAAEEDFKYRLQDWETKWKRQGFVTTEKPKIDDIDWEKYSDLKNFELLREDEQFDDHLSKRYNVDVYIKYKKYRYKGYSNTYTLMESGNAAVKRARNIK